jgi:hypothetical protein
MTETRDGIAWRAHALVEKFDDDQVAYALKHRERRLWTPRRLGRIQRHHFERLGIRPFEVIESPGNLLTTAGVTRAMSLILAAGGQGATATSARIGVGNGAGTAVIGDTDLSASAGAGNRYFMPMDSTFPSSAAGVGTFRSTFATADGNFVWNEWCIDIGTPTVAAGTTVSATLLNHKTSAALGTKTSGAWTLTATITLS